jgi:GAF domain-containing protein
MSNLGFDPFGDHPRMVDTSSKEREARLDELGLLDRLPDTMLDDVARELAFDAGSQHGMVNLVGEEQHLAGLHLGGGSNQDPTPDSLRGPLDLDFGYCLHVVVRRKALVLDDVCEYPRFAGNVVVDRLGVRTYLGAPLIDRTGTVLGTVCVIDSEPRSWGQEGLRLIKEHAARVVDLLQRGEQASGGAHSR